MGVGPKIKELRIKAGLTQKDLADQLHVTYQAVSRWEKGDVEPSIDTLKEMCGILNCSIEELFEMDKKEEEQKVEEPVAEETKQTEEKVTVVEKVVIEKPKPILAICDTCRKPIYENSDLCRFTETVKVRTGRSHYTKDNQLVLCNSCYEARMAEKNRLEALRQREIKDSFRKKRVHSFVWSILVACVFFIIAISLFGSGDSTAGIACIVTGILSFFFIATMILDNTFINDMWIGITSLGFVKFPGIIFSLDFDGLKFLIIMKLIFLVLGYALAILATVLATAIAMPLSVFAYPFALRKNIKYIE